ncbi:MAG: DUF3703 domain-containing protein [Alphaproteobacteria bacterium]|nr:MAG: DUF3703 domain-containing protein [Alphaproteobacteria bacterium]
MKPYLKKAFREEMAQAKSFYHTGHYRDSFRHLERAHILGQRHFAPHLQTHWWMLKVGYRTRDMRELLGQFLRLAGCLGSLIGKVPLGNTGGANVSPVKSMPIPQDLAAILDDPRSF